MITKPDEIVYIRDIEALATPEDVRKAALRDMNLKPIKSTFIIVSASQQLETCFRC